jgi:cell division protein ZapA (FtsZ GTPase activity inhibitor)
MRKVWILSLLAAILVSLGIFTFNIFGKENNQEPKNDVTKLSEKIDRVLKNQEDIISRLAEIRQELDVIRVRASRR